MVSEGPWLIVVKVNVSLTVCFGEEGVSKNSTRAIKWKVVSVPVPAVFRHREERLPQVYNIGNLICNQHQDWILHGACLVWPTQKNTKILFISLYFSTPWTSCWFVPCFIKKNNRKGYYWGTCILKLKNSCIWGSSGSIETDHLMYSLAVDLPLTLWSQCECQPCHCGPQWKLVGWRRSRFSVLPGRCAEPFPRPSARETAQSCRWPTQVLRTDLLLQDVRTETTCIACTTRPHPPPPSLKSAICSHLISSKGCSPWRP